MPGFISIQTVPVTYLNVPKAGCTSFKNWLYRLEHGTYYHSPIDIHDVVNRTMIQYDAHTAKMEQRFQETFVFTFVRHPLRRAYSVFNEKVLQQGTRHFPGVRKLVQEKYGARLSPTADINEMRSDFLAFLRFVRDTQTRKINFRADFHWMPQSTVLAEAYTTHRPIDFIGRIETIQSDFEFVCKKIGIPPEPMPHFNESPKPPFKYEEIVNDDIRDLGLTIYRADLRNFAYSID